MKQRSIYIAWMTWVMTWVLGAMVLMAGCEEFATPAELSKTQILAIRAQPVSVEPGDSAELDILVADAGGAIAAPEVSWRVAPGAGGAPGLGTIEAVRDGLAVYTAPAAVDEQPTLASVMATVQTDEGELTGVKGVVIGSLPLANPDLVAFTADGSDILAAGALTVDAGQIVTLEVATEPAMTEDSTVSWYSTVGEIEQYRSNPADMVVQDEVGSGWLFAVVRDGLGGVAWQGVEVTVE